MAGKNHDRIFDLALVREQTLRIRDLRGFQKSHSVPAESTNRTIQFVARIAEQDLGQDLDQYFDSLRRAFNYSRRQLVVSEPTGGVAAIETPEFEYRIVATQSDSVPTEVVMRRQVSRFADLNVVKSEEFSRAFGSLFNAVELTFAKPLLVEDVIDWVEEQSGDAALIDYDRTALWCSITLRGIPGGVLHVQADCLKVSTAAPNLAPELLQVLEQFRRELPRIDRWLSE